MRGDTEHPLTPGQKLDLTLVFSRDEEEGFVIAECLELPGCMSQGRTEAEAKANVMGAIEACISVMLEDAIKSSGAGRETAQVQGVRHRVSLVIPHLVDSRG